MATVEQSEACTKLCTTESAKAPHVSYICHLQKPEKLLHRILQHLQNMEPYIFVNTGECLKKDPYFQTLKRIFLESLAS